MREKVVTFIGGVLATPDTKKGMSNYETSIRRVIYENENGVKIEVVGDIIKAVHKEVDSVYYGEVADIGLKHLIINRSYVSVYSFKKYRFELIKKGG